MGALLISVITLVTIWALLYYRVKLWQFSMAIVIILALFQLTSQLHLLSSIIIWPITISLILFFNIKSLRQKYLSKKLFTWFKTQLPPVSETEKTALEAGNVWWDADLFQGLPKFNKLTKTKFSQLSNEEQIFLDNQVEQFCSMLSEWQINYKDFDLPRNAWDYLKQEKFFGMVIDKQHGGLGFSELAHSQVISKIAGCSIVAAVTVMVPNSLGPGELIQRYGTKKQQQEFLPKLANGQHIPCFGLTGPEVGSDATALPDYGIITKQNINGEEVLGLSLTFDKRYITLAPVATIIGLAIRCYDPDHLLSEEEDRGITVCLLPGDTPGVEQGARHYPSGLSFMNGTLRGKDVFIPLENIIGGEKRIGEGWRMLVECLSVGRGISLPSLGAAATKFTFLTTGAYAKIRRQFNTSVGNFEGVQEKLAQIGMSSYILEAMRLTTVSAIDAGEKPGVITAICKYHMTELARSSVNNSMDIHGGKSIIVGERNYLNTWYQSMPISITVEGANILTRNLMIFGQGAIRCHPFLLDEIHAAQGKSKQSFLKFDKILFKHVGYSVSNIARTFALGLTLGKLAVVPKMQWLTPYAKRTAWLSTTLACVGDISLMYLGGALKRKELLSARLGDVLSYLYMSSCIIKYYQQNGTEEEKIYAEASIKWCLFQGQQALILFLDNFPNSYIAKILKLICFPFATRFRQPEDKFITQIAKNMQTNSILTERWKSQLFTGFSEQEQLAKLYRCFELMQKLEPTLKIYYKYLKSLDLPVTDHNAMIQQAYQIGIIDENQEADLIEYETLRKDIIAVDEFQNIGEVFAK